MQQLYDARDKINKRVQSMTLKERREYYAKIENDAKKRGIVCADKVTSLC